MKDTIYLLTPNGQTGGIELLYQLGDYLQKKGEKVKLLFFEKKSLYHEIDAYKKYRVEKVFLEETSKGETGIIVVPEALASYIACLPNMVKYCWWESVDNYYQRIPNFFDSISLIGLPRTIWHYWKSIRGLFLGNRRPTLKKIDKVVCKHLVQSEYARRHLLKKGVKSSKIFSLSDYISDDFLSLDSIENADYRKPIVVYNPKKGKLFTSKIIAFNPDICFVPIQNMNNVQIRDLFFSSKVYIDFGNHPGKDRLPREAAICGCCIITDRVGAANNDVDIPIPSRYKISAKKSNLSKIRQEILRIFIDYQFAKGDFKKYRENIQGEKDLFFKEVNEIFGLK